MTRHYLPLLIPVLALAAAPLARAQSCTPVESATYRVTFDAMWSSTSHPTNYPVGAHFSRLIGGTHNSNYVMWEPGGIATNPMEQMAEFGSSGPLQTQVNNRIADGTAERVLRGPSGSINATGQNSITFTITSEYPLVSLVTMIAPSPDWFVGVHDLALYENGAFHDMLIVDLQPYDSGTDAGANFTSPDSDVTPHDPITLITTSPLDNGVPLGQFIFEKLVESCLDLCATDVVTGQTATIEVSGGTPGEDVAVLYGLARGSFAGSKSGYCFDFGLDLTLANANSRIVALGTFDGTGSFSVTTPTIPAFLLGSDLYFQAAERNTCPDPCMSPVVRRIVQ